MFIINIEYPGTWLELQNTEKTSDIESLLGSMDTSLIDMAITLTMFIDCQQDSYSEHTLENMERLWKRDRELHIHIEKEYRNSLTNENDFYDNSEHHRSKIEKLYRQEKIRNGEVPRSYKHRFSFIHAHSFLSSVDSFYKYLSVLSNETNLEHVKTIKQKFEGDFPLLSKVRNSAQHSEDRIRGYGRSKKKKMDLQDGFLGLSNLNGNLLGYTIDDGTYQEFSISQDTLHKVSNLFQSLINGFQWKGPSKTSPHI